VNEVIAIALDPTSTSALIGRGIAHRNQGHLKAAMDDFNQVLAIGDYDALVYHHRDYSFC
jgi:hypothetical protein